MTWFSAAAVKIVGATSVAALLSLGAAGVLAQSVPSGTATSVSSKAPATDRSDRRAIAKAVFEAEADVLGIKPETLRDDLKKGQSVSDLAKDKGMTKEQFETKLLANLKPRLAALVSAKVITQKQADKVLDRIAKGHIPFWNGKHHRPKK
jgi:hypothetical protein